MPDRRELVPGPILAMFLALVVGSILGYSAPTPADHEAAPCEAAP